MTGKGWSVDWYRGDIGEDNNDEIGLGMRFLGGGIEVGYGLYRN